MESSTSLTTNKADPLRLRQQRRPMIDEIAGKLRANLDVRDSTDIQLLSVIPGILKNERVRGMVTFDLLESLLQDMTSADRGLGIVEAKAL